MYIINNQVNQYLVKLASGGGIRVRGNRLYPSLKEAEKNLPYKFTLEVKEKPVLRDDNVVHSPRYYGWVCEESK